MKILLHLPRNSEAEIEPKLNSDIIVRPKFYKKSGWVPVFYITTVDNYNHEERHVFSISASTKQLKVEKLLEVIPAFNDKEQERANDRRSADDETAED